MDERISKLPKWARTEIETRDREIAKLEKELVSMRGEVEVEGSPVTLRYRGSLSEPIPIDPYAEFGYRTEDGQRFSVVARGGQLRISTLGRIVIHPQVTNVILASSEGWKIGA